jgi:NADH dehydrogenase/NADH:ubiquinone oxidoreductase subunit G
MNYQGRIQRFYRAYDATGTAAEALRLLSHLGGGLDATYDYNDVEDVWADLRARHTELGDLSWYGIGDGGFQVPSLVREPAAAAT